MIAHRIHWADEKLHCYQNYWRNELLSERVKDEVYFSFACFALWYD